MKIKNMAKILILISSIFTMPVFALSALTDQEMSEVEGQALFNLSYLGPTEDVDPTTAGVQTNAGNNIGFYTFSMEAEVALNANARSMKLGCGGDNGAGACDIDIERFSLGCIANAAGTCITLVPTGNQKTGVNNDNSDAGQQRMRDFVLSNPFYQFAIKTPTVAATREVVGVRIGAANVKGPMSFDSINTFSGYLTGKSNVEMRGQGPRTGNLAADLQDVAVTCKAPNNCPNAAGRSDYTNNPNPPCTIASGCANNQSGSAMGDYQYMGLDNATLCLIPVIACADLNQLTISFTGIQRNNRPAAVSGVRQTKAFISDLNLGTGTNTVGGVSENGVVKSITDSMEIERTSNFFGASLLNFILPILKGNAANLIVNQLASGLGTTAAELNNNTYKLPYNLSNVHQLEIDSTTFGLALSKQVLQYPGFTQSVGMGWSMYIPNAFTLDISDRTTTFVQGIAQSTNAKDGNIVGLEAPFRNCWGNARFY